ncbi:MAG TPA: nuclear transport factor 2 family protein [Chryseosolibacter sp.]
MKSVYPLILVFILAACVQTQNASSEISETETKKVLDHHWEAFKANDLEETMADYTDESVLITPTATYRGLQEIRTNFVNAFKAFPSDSATFVLENSIVVKDVGYILWNSKTPTFNLTFGTDTFIIRNGKIVRQTFAGVFQ